MNEEIKVELGEHLSRKACAAVIKSLIKFIAYNNQQIPYSYDGFQRLINRKRFHSIKENNLKSKPLTFKEIKANHFYEKIEGIYDAFEATFKCIEEELVRGSSLKEIIILLGSTLVSPKHLYRIQIPSLLIQEDGESKIRSHLFKIYRSIISSSGFLSRCSGLTNMFVLVNGQCNAGWFVPKMDFRVPPKASQTLISFDGDVVCRTGQDGSSDQPDSWFQAKQALNGFQDLKIDGVSAYNMLLG